MSGCPLWAYPGFDNNEDDYSEESSPEIYFDDDEDDEESIVPQVDEWGNEIDEHGNVGIDQTIHSERMFEKHIRRLFYISQNIPQEVKSANSQRIKEEKEAQKQRTKEIHDRLVANQLAWTKEHSIT